MNQKIDNVVKAIVEKGEYPDLTTADNSDPAFLYALTFAVADYLCANIPDTPAMGNVLGLFKKGLSMEYQGLLFKQVLQKPECKRALYAHPDFLPIAREFVDMLFDKRRCSCESNYGERRRVR